MSLRSRRTNEAGDLLNNQKLCVVVRLKDIRHFGCGCQSVFPATEEPDDGSSSHRRSAELCSPSAQNDTVTLTPPQCLEQ